MGEGWLNNAGVGLGAPVPSQIADKLRGREFANFDAFRRAVWAEVGKNPELLKQFRGNNQGNLKNAYSPFTPKSERVGGRTRYELHHVKPISEGGAVDWILNQGRTLGVRARLRHKLDYLWRSCSGELSGQNDLFRLTYALELAKQYDWVYHVLSDSEWSGRRQIQPSASVNSICLLKSALDIGFNDDGMQVTPVPARIGGRADGLNALLKSCRWEAVSNDDHWKLVTISAG